MLMQQKKLICNVKCNVHCIGLIRKIDTNIGFRSYENIRKIKDINTKITTKEFLLNKYTSKLRGPITNLLSVDCFIGIKNIESICKKSTVLEIKFDINKENYNMFSPFIFDNIDILYNRITFMFKKIKNIISSKRPYVYDTYEYNEDIFINVLNNLENKYSNYEDIEDKYIASVITNGFRSFKR